MAIVQDLLMVYGKNGSLKRTEVSRKLEAVD